MLYCYNHRLHLVIYSVQRPYMCQMNMIQTIALVLLHQGRCKQGQYYFFTNYIHMLLFSLVSLRHDVIAYVTMSRCHDVTMSRCHDVTMSRCHDVTMSRCHDVTMSRCQCLCHDVTVCVTLSVLMSRCHCSFHV